MDEILKLRARLTELHSIAAGIQAKADAEKREATADELRELEAVLSEFDNVEADIKRRERIVAQEQRLGTSTGRQTAPNPIAGQTPTPSAAAAAGLPNTVLRTVEERQRWGFGNMGEFCQAVRSASIGRGLDQRLVQAAATTYGSEGAGVDGGFAVPPEWRAAIMKQVDAEDSLLPRCDVQTISTNSITYPVDETTSWQSTGGILAYWDGEASTINQTKPQLKDLTAKLHRLTALVPVTDELLEDAAAMSSYITGKAGEKISFKITDAVVNGTGAGMPLGLMNAPCKIAVAKVTSQVAATFHAKNAIAMMARMPASAFARSVWLVNQDAMPQIMQMGFPVTDGTTTVAGAGALYMGPGQLAGQSTYGQLLGRPIVVTEACQTLGTEGDVILADLSKYLAVVKGGGVKSDVSIHLFFDQNMTAFRFVFRMNGQNWLSAPIARKNGSNTLSHVVTCAVRS